MELYNLLKQYLAARDINYSEMKYGIAFQQNKLDYVFIADKDDEQYFRLVMPCILDMQGNDELAVYHAINRINSGFKVVKAFVDDDVVNIAFEILADSTPVVDDFMPRAVTLLSQARKAFYTALDNYSL